jgi:hypothetical protein
MSDYVAGGIVPKPTRHESPEIGAMIGRMLNALIRRAAEGDWEALEALAEIEGTARSAMTAGLVVSREHYSLAQLAGVMGVTRSAIAQRASTGPEVRASMVAHTPGCGHARCVGVKRCRRG